MPFVIRKKIRENNIKFFQYLPDLCTTVILGILITEALGIECDVLIWGRFKNEPKVSRLSPIGNGNDQCLLGTYIVLQ